MAHPAVAEAVVISSPDLARGEVVKAFVVIAQRFQDTSPDVLGRELQAFCKENAAPYKYPRKIEFVNSGDFPRTTSGKIQRSVLRKAEWKLQNKPKL
jgi:medium-chain acyl-CoA synthetase